MLLWLLSACGSFECDRLYTPDLLMVRVGEGVSWPPGEHTVTVTDAETFAEVRCTATLPDENFSCSDDISVVQFVDGGLDRVEVWELAPETVTVEVTVDGAVVLLEDFQPEYEAFEPNGEGCGVQQVGGIDVSW